MKVNDHIQKIILKLFIVNSAVLRLISSYQYSKNTFDRRKHNKKQSHKNTIF